jgi:GNAT superfamily N-acetyltransferase
MEIRKFNSIELKEFIYSEEYKNLKVIPITRHRALSHINNPRVSPNDPILYLAYDKGELVGYRIVMADKIFLDNKEHKIGWYSCVWVDPNNRGKGIAKEVVKASLEDWENKIVLGDPVAESKALYLQTGQFTDIVKPTGIRGYLRFSITKIFINKIPALNKIKLLLQVIDYLLNIPNNIRLILWENSIKVNRKDIEYITEIDKEVELFITENNKQDLSRRNKTELNWILKFPWVLMNPIKDEYMEKFYFSSQSKQFFNLSIKINNREKLSAFLIITIRDGNLKIPFISLSNEVDLKKVLDVIYHHMLRYNLSTFTTFNSQLAQYIKNHPNPFILTKSIQRQFLFGKLFENQLLTNKVYIQDGEGDTAFT